MAVVFGSDGYNLPYDSQTILRSTRIREIAIESSKEFYVFKKQDELPITNPYIHRIFN